MVRVAPEKGARRWVLTDAGIRYVCAAARASSDEPRRFWSAVQRVDGTYRGSKLRKLRRERRHTDMVHALVARFAGEAAAAVAVTGFQILPAHLTERRPILPDARLDLEVKRNGGSAEWERYVLLLEAERGTLSRDQMEKRLGNYARFFARADSWDEFPVRPHIAVVLEDAAMESGFSSAQVRAGPTHLPIILTNGQRLLAPGGGFLQPVWRRPGQYGERGARFMDLRQRQN